MSEVKLLTEAEAKGAWGATYVTHAKSFDAYCADLRERGLIAPEPEKADPLEDARRRAFKAWQDYSGSAEGAVWFAIEVAINSGLKLAPAARPLTREEVKQAYLKADNAVFGGIGIVRTELIDALHTALTEARDA